MDPVVICSVLESDPEAAARRVAAAPAGCALVELRADRLSAAQVEEVLGRAGRPLIVTVRALHDGGSFQGSESERREILVRALAAGAAFIDVEWAGALADLARGLLADRVILSHHGAPCDSSSLRVLLDEMRATRAARIKIVPRAQSIRDAEAVRELLRHAATPGAPVACFALGVAGLATRILAPSWGSWATYGSAARGRETGDGQLLAAELLDVHDVLHIGPDTLRFALLGSPVTASPSPALHGHGYRAAGLRAVYLPLDAASIDEALWASDADSALRVSAFGVTIPLKEEVALRSQPGDPCAAAAGAVNTVLVREGRWIGYNTDGPAVASCVRRRLDPRGARVAVVGAGGTARASGWALREAGAAVTFFNRDLPRAQRAAADLDGAAAALDALATADWDILIQATPLGRAGEEVPVGKRLSGRLVLDAAYGPDPTPLVARARASGLSVVDGHELLCEQALLQFERMTGHAPSRDGFTTALREHMARG